MSLTGLNCQTKPAKLQQKFGIFSGYLFQQHMRYMNEHCALIDMIK
jgi:hypothetical protein